jgi:hypothetical protein
MFYFRNDLCGCGPWCNGKISGCSSDFVCKSYPNVHIKQNNIRSLKYYA